MAVAIVRISIDCNEGQHSTSYEICSHRSALFWLLSLVMFTSRAWFLHCMPIIFWLAFSRLQSSGCFFCQCCHRFGIFVNVIHRMWQNCPNVCVPNAWNCPLKWTVWHKWALNHKMPCNTRQSPIAIRRNLSDLLGTTIDQRIWHGSETILIQLKQKSMPSTYSWQLQANAGVLEGINWDPCVAKHKINRP